MIKILTVIGARPQIIKAAALSRAIRTHHASEITEIIVHTGQHYDENMSGVFFDELQIPRPNYNLNVGSAGHGKQTALMIQGLEEILVEEKPDYIVLYGDTNSTLAGAVAAAKLHIPVVHIEAGLRSFNKKMPEEINRIMCDHVSTLLFSPTVTGVKNLQAEGFKIDNVGPYSSDNPKVYQCGDIMYDNSLYFAGIAEKKDVVCKLGLQKDSFILATIHRDNNTDNPERLKAIFKAFNHISKERNISVVLPLHPRTAKLLEKNVGEEMYAEITNNKLIHIIPPVSFIEMIALESQARIVMTDSGGVQKEAFFFCKPCVILRPETEWVELVEAGTAIIADADTDIIVNAYHQLIDMGNLTFPQVFGDGKASEFICQAMLDTCNA